MKDLAKLDLDPNTVYNVSLSVSQGAKKFDNLRFFQTKTPKLFNIIPGQYSTFSRLTTALEPVVPKIGGGVFTPADLRYINVTRVSWVTNWVYDRSEGETTYNLAASTVTFTVKVASNPNTFNFSIDGFEANFACLNGRSDWTRINGTTYEVTVPLKEYVPDITANPGLIRDYINNAIAQTKFDNRPGNTLIYTKAKPKNVVKGQEVTFQVRGAAAFPTHTKVLQVVSSGSTHYLILSAPNIIQIKKDQYLNFSTVEWTKGLSAYTEKGGVDSAARMSYYTSPSYSPITTTYSFTGNSSVTSEVLNATVLDALIWEEGIRDFIYFFISDTTGGSIASPTWYYFNNSSGNGGITTTADLSGRKINGTPLSIASGSGEERVLNPPPAAPGFVTNTSTYPSYPAIALKAKTKFYDISKTNAVNDATLPNTSYPVSIRFAIARYTKGATGAWSGSWLGIDNRIKNVLSLEEVIS